MALPFTNLHIRHGYAPSNWYVKAIARASNRPLSSYRVMSVTFLEFPDSFYHGTLRAGVLIKE